MFLQASVILLTGEVPDQVHPPGPGTPHQGQGTPQDQVHSPWTRYTPQDEVHPLGTRHLLDQVQLPLDQVHPPGTRYTPRGQGTPWTRYTPPQTRYTPWDQVHTPQDQVHPSDQVHPPDQVQTPGPGTPFRTRACWEIRSTRGRYASYWNATCLGINVLKLKNLESFNSRVSDISVLCWSQSHSYHLNSTRENGSLLLECLFVIFQ